MIAYALIVVMSLMEAYAINSNLDETIIECPKCNKEMEVFMSMEYTCIAIEEQINRRQ